MSLVPYLLDNLVIDRVDLVDEGANSAAFIQLYKRKERCAVMDVNEILSKLKPEHAGVIQQELDRLNGEVEKGKTAQSELATAQSELATAQAEITTLKSKLPCECDGEADENGVCKSCGCTKKSNEDNTCNCDGEADENGICKACGKTKAFDETETLKRMPIEAQKVFAKMRAQKEAAEAELRKAKEAEAEAEAVTKAASLKSLPVSQDTLVGIVKNCSTEVFEVLSTINTALDGVVLNEIGKSSEGLAGAWEKIEAKASEIASRDNVTKQKAISIAIKENPGLYDDYLRGGAN